VADPAVQVVLGHDARDSIGPERRRQPLPRLGRQHLARVLQRPGGAHQPAGRQGDGHVEAAVLEVELAITQIGGPVPPAQVVVDRDLGVPLGDLEGASPERILPGGAEGARRRDLVLPGELEARRSAGRDRLGEPHLHERPHDSKAGLPRAQLRRRAGRELPTTGRHPGQLHPARHRDMAVPRDSGCEDVLVQVDHDLLQHVGRVVPVLDPAFPPKDGGGGVQLDVDRVGHLLLPVGRPRLARVGAGPGLDRALHRPRHRDLPEQVVGRRGLRLRNGRRRRGGGWRGGRCAGGREAGYEQQRCEEGAGHGVTSCRGMEERQGRPEAQRAPSGVGIELDGRAARGSFRAVSRRCIFTRSHRAHIARTSQSPSSQP
jgi:hypothetical protein